MVVASAVVKGTTAAEGGVPARRPGVGHAALRRGRYRSATVVVVLATGLLGGTASGAPLQVGRSGPAGHEAGLHPSLRSPAGPTTAPVPRSSTLYTSGTALSPPRSFDPLSPTAYTGAQGLLYEPLFLYDPVKEQLMPWLASAGRWVTPTSYVLRLRPGERWVSSASGRAEGEVSGADVAYSLQLARTDVADPYHGLVGSVRAVSASGGVVTVSFAGPVGYAQWQEYLWHAPVLPRAVWSALPPGQRTSNPDLSPVASGPMLLESVSSTGACYRVNPHWWGSRDLGLRFAFSHLCDEVSGPSGSQLSALLSGRLDWSNALLRGVTDLTGTRSRGYGVQTYYPAPPYMLAANTVYLETGRDMPKVDGVDFRMAVASALSPSVIATEDYSGTVQVAGPTGVLPELARFVDRAVVRRFGFSYSPKLARHYLEESGYRGQLLHLLVPSGLADLEAAASTMAQQLDKAGVRVAVLAEPAPQRRAQVASGHFQLAIALGPGLASSPWPYFDQVYNQAAGSAGGAAHPVARALLAKAASTPTWDTSGLLRAYAALEARFLQRLPVVPLWYTGAWFQASTAHWAGYPSSSDRRDWYTPVMWPGWLGAATTVLALAHLVRA